MQELHASGPASSGTRIDERSSKVRLRGVTREFDLGAKKMVALAPITLDIYKGEFLCIVGPSGCGKTTLLRILADLEAETAGDIEFVRDAAPAGSSESPARRLNSMVFQEHGIFPWMTVIDNVAFGLKAQGMPKAERHAIAGRYIDKVGLGAFRDAYPHQLSGGMKQRVSIARAFANDPELLLMDEPFAALDEQTKIVLQAELLRIWEETQKTVVYVTHSIDEAIVLADRVMVMTYRPGRIKQLIDVRGIFPRPRNVETVKSSHEYGDLFGQIWGCLREEVQAHERAERRQ